MADLTNPAVHSFHAHLLSSTNLDRLGKPDGLETMASSTLLTVSLVTLLGAHAVGGAHLHPPRAGHTTETRDDSAGTFTINQIRNPNFKGKSGLEAMIDVYEKYGVELTPQLKKAVQINTHFAASRRSSCISNSLMKPFD